MINPNFINLIENTKKEAKLFFELNPSAMTAQDLINLAQERKIFDNSQIDEDLFKHLMKRYTA